MVFIETSLGGRYQTFWIPVPLMLCTILDSMTSVLDWEASRNQEILN